jgi:hypothetical protein
MAKKILHKTKAGIKKNIFKKDQLKGGSSLQKNKKTKSVAGSRKKKLISKTAHKSKNDLKIIYDAMLKLEQKINDQAQKIETSQEMDKHQQEALFNLQKKISDCFSGALNDDLIDEWQQMQIKQNDGETMTADLTQNLKQIARRVDELKERVDEIEEYLHQLSEAFRSGGEVYFAGGEEKENHGSSPQAEIPQEKYQWVEPEMGELNFAPEGIPSVAATRDSSPINTQELSAEPKIEYPLPERYQKMSLEQIVNEYEEVRRVIGALQSRLNHMVMQKNSLHVLETEKSKQHPLWTDVFTEIPIEKNELMQIKAKEVQLNNDINQTKTSLQKLFGILNTLERVIQFRGKK